MFGLDVTVLAIILLAGLSAGAVAYVFLFNTIANENKAGKRLETIKKAETDRAVVKASRDRLAEAAKRRKSVQDSLNDLDAKQKVKDRNMRKPPLKLQIKQAGLTLTIERFYLFSAISGFLFAALALLGGAPLWAVPAAGLAAGVGLPRWVIALIKARRIKAFLDELPNALDIIVRAVKSGLPINDGIRLIASESREPVRTEFRRMVDTMPCPEAAFFGIVIQIQAQAGGNLSEALGNLSRVLRDRKRMKAKIQALSMEAKASAAIIGALPFIVAFLVYISSPNYIMPLFVTSTGHIVLGVSLIWMAIGIFVMKKMMNFEV